jgi:hypothetical protein
MHWHADALRDDAATASNSCAKNFNKTARDAPKGEDVAFLHGSTSGILVG